MAQIADQEAYEGIIAALLKFQNSVEETCSSMQNAVNDCIDNMDQDGHAMERTSELSQALPKIHAIAEEAGEIAAKIQKEWDRIASA